MPAINPEPAVTPAKSRTFGSLMQADANGRAKEIGSIEEIEAILNLACSHRWNFSYMVASERRQSSHTTELVAVNARAGTITVGSEVKYSGLQAQQKVVFRAQSGGISIQFETEMLGSGGNALSNRLFSECRIKMPEVIRFNQLRKSIRVDCNDLDDIRVTLFANATRLQGLVADLSTTGTKIRFSGNLTYQFKQSRMVTDCRLRLPDGSVLEARVKVLGFFYDKEQDISYLRCYFLEIREDNELMLADLIQAALIAKPQPVVHF
jgi:c-di-GMP-binding flagellar brake protein YcgR